MKKIILFAGIVVVILFVLINCSGVLQTLKIGNGIIRGTVIDQDNKPVVGAIITTDPATESTVSTFEGFVIKNVPVGYYIVKATKQGYSTAAIEIRVQRNKISQADIQIKSIK
ncbi:MAG TPA: carboxypeptidase-like regulatory domain-containing protein [bacterium]|nr:carboxypeptidase-like regulatory domain-containing protein [bacterium]HOL47320.1 carboxypeptidase-like regulatory domain-containing protein [bacterium]HPQ17976.1 carboxypeptidase-like regulatory domain-containing protein [bacterium]